MCHPAGSVPRPPWFHPKQLSATCSSWGGGPRALCRRAGTRGARTRPSAAPPAGKEGRWRTPRHALIQPASAHTKAATPALPATCDPKPPPKPTPSPRTNLVPLLELRHVQPDETLREKSSAARWVSTHALQLRSPLDGTRLCALCPHSKASDGKPFHGEQLNPLSPTPPADGRPRGPCSTQPQQHRGEELYLLHILVDVLGRLLGQLRFTCCKHKHTVSTPPRPSALPRHNVRERMECFCCLHQL